MGIPAQDVSSFYGDEGDNPWAANTYKPEMGYSARSRQVVMPNAYENQFKEFETQQRLAELDRFKKNLPELQQIEDIQRQEKLQSGLSRLDALKRQSAFQQEMAKGGDPYAPENRAKIFQALAQGATTPSMVSTLERYAPKNEALLDNVANISSIDPSDYAAEEKLNQYIQGADKSLHVTPEFRHAVTSMRSAINSHKSRLDEGKINKAEQLGVDASPYVEGNRIIDKEGFDKAYRRGLAEARILPPAARQEMFNLLTQHQSRLLKGNQIPEELIQEYPHATPEELKARHMEWINQPLREWQARQNALNALIESASKSSNPYSVPINQAQTQNPGARDVNAIADKLIGLNM